ncbi:DUF488 domain-containing protein [Roseovarius tibetensis]|uniref:DUF488 domain-containing protein n=1 Tax=Roseovarius tibetensis TaxID=2685897 RepID=UPI003D7FC89D
MTDTPFQIRLARVHDDLSDLSGARLLVDRVWPRGVRKDALQADDWIRDAAPSSGLRKWFGHDPARWDGFRSRYLAELGESHAAVARCLAWCCMRAVPSFRSARRPWRTPDRPTQAE